MASLFGIGGLLGLVLYHAAFGFTSAWRQLLLNGDGTGLRAQMIMLARATIIFLANRVVLIIRHNSIYTNRAQY